MFGLLGKYFADGHRSMNVGSILKSNYDVRGNPAIDYHDVTAQSIFK
jgi:hypothetical protein